MDSSRIAIPLLFETADLPDTLRDFVYIDFRDGARGGAELMRSFYRELRLPLPRLELNSSQRGAVRERSWVP